MDEFDRLFAEWRSLHEKVVPMLVAIGQMLENKVAPDDPDFAGLRDRARELITDKILIQRRLDEIDDGSHPGRSALRKEAESAALMMNAMLAGIGGA